MDRKKIIVFFLMLFFSLCSVPITSYAGDGGVGATNKGDSGSTGIQGNFSGHDKKNKIYWVFGKTENAKKTINYNTLQKNFSSSVRKTSYTIPKGKKYCYLKLVNGSGNECAFHWQAIGEWNSIKPFMQGMTKIRRYKTPVGDGNSISSLD